MGSAGLLAQAKMTTQCGQKTFGDHLKSAIKPTEEEILRVLAEQVMGWTRFDFGDGNTAWIYAGDLKMQCKIWDPLSNIEQAMKCAEKHHRFELQMSSVYARPYHCTIFDCFGNKLGGKSGITPAEAISRACYAAVREEGDKP